MKKYIVRKEWFGGIVSDIEKYKLKQIDKNQYSIISAFLYNEPTIKIIDNNNIVNNQLSFPLSVTIYPSLKCYQNCSFCYVRQIKRLNKCEMTYSSFCYIVDKLKEHGIFDIEIMGGEPLLVPWIIDAIKYICDNDIHCSINTNINALSLSFLKGITNINNLSLRISIQDYQKTLDTHTEQVFLCLKELNIKVDILTVLQKCNYKNIKYLINNLNSSFVKYLILLYNSPLPKEKPDYDTTWFYNTSEKISKTTLNNNDIKIVAKGPYGNSNYDKDDSKLLEYIDGVCNACVSRFEILPDGSVFPCVKYYSNTEDLIGNILSEDVLTIWNNEKSNRIREIIERHKTHNNCSTCTWKNNCSGCIGYAQNRNYDVDDRCPKKGNNNEEHTF